MYESARGLELGPVPGSIGNGHPSQAQAIRVAQVGPDPAGRGGMASVLQTLLHSPLASDYALTMIVSWRDVSLRARLRLFASALVALSRFCLVGSEMCIRDSP